MPVTRSTEDIPAQMEGAMADDTLCAICSETLHGEGNKEETSCKHTFAFAHGWKIILLVPFVDKFVIPLN